MKAAFYTAIFGNKDELPIIQDYRKSDDFHFLCFTDNENLKSDIYEIVYVKPCLEDITKNARKIKILGFEGMDDYDYLIWHDANVHLKFNKLHDLIQLAEKHEVMFFDHSTRDCAYEEIIKCMKVGKDYYIRLLFHAFYLFLKGFKRHEGLFETKLYVKKTNNKKIAEFSKRWWLQIKRLSRRDQVSVNYCFNKSNLNKGRIPGNQWINEFYNVVDHTHARYEDKKSRSWLNNRLLNSLSYRIMLILLKVLDKQYNRSLSKKINN